MAKAYKPLPHASELWELFDYKPLTGELVWRTSRGRTAKAGTPAGSVERKGYVRVIVKGEKYLAHRLVYVWVTGFSPDSQVDHGNRDKADNCCWNLRPADSYQNGYNREGRNKYGFKGVSRAKGKYRAYISHLGRQIYVGGGYETPEEAGAAYAKAAAELHGEFACIDKGAG
jgi:hypothetical protein